MEILGAKLAQLSEFDELIDVRSPCEYAEDHIPGAWSCPVLDDAERARVGTLYKQVSSFSAKKIGAVLVARNIARHIEAAFIDKPKHWRPLVYCWRGGKRSAAMAHMLRQIGWHAAALEGGYRSYRRQVVADLSGLPPTFRFRVVCGPTGSGKSLLLQALARLGAQVLDLEDLAAHRGSVLGSLPDRVQPTQKLFEGSIWNSLKGFDRNRPVYVEAESKRIGALQVPDALLAAMWSSACIRIDAVLEARVTFLKSGYGHFFSELDRLRAGLEPLARLHGRQRVDQWLKLASAERWDPLVESLLVEHYDPAYARATASHYPRISEATVIRLAAINGRSAARAARLLVDEVEAERVL